MRIPFTKMHGAGNDFIVIDETRQRYGLKPEHYRHMAHRHTGVGADQILTVRPSPAQGVDFEYLIHNADGGQVQQCGNGARCFARFVHAKGLSAKTTITVQTMSGVIRPELLDTSRVRVDMGAPVLEPARVPFVAHDVSSRALPVGHVWSLQMPSAAQTPDGSFEGFQAAWALTDEAAAARQMAECVVLSMGNPHAVFMVNDVENAPVALWGQYLQNHPAFPERVNVGFLQMHDGQRASLRVFERGVGETLSCGTGACAAAVAAMLQGLASSALQVQTRGGLLTIEWTGQENASVYLTGPTAIVFEGEMDLPDTF